VISKLDKIAVLSNHSTPHCAGFFRQSNSWNCLKICTLQIESKIDIYLRPLESTQQIANAMSTDEKGIQNTHGHGGRVEN